VLIWQPFAKKSARWNGMMLRCFRGSSVRRLCLYMYPHTSLPPSLSLYAMMSFPSDARHDVSKRAPKLSALLQRRTKMRHLEKLCSSSTLAFARPSIQQLATSIGTLVSPIADRARGFPNLGNTCYINAVLQCLLHCTPFRHDLERQPVGSSFMGDCLKNLWAVYKNSSATPHDVHLPLTALVQQILTYANFPGGRQQDAAECLMNLLKAVDEGRMQRRVCGAYAASSIESMILCRSPPETHVSREAPAVSMAHMLTASLTDDQALREDPPALVVRV